jgi:hypothetical protein
VRCEERDHYYPSNEECMACHTASAHFLLGASTRQWNREVDSGGQRQNQVVLASQRGLLDARLGPADPAGWKRLVAIDDRSAPIDERVRSYLDANCSQCHRAGMVVGVGIDTRYDTPLEHQGLIGGLVRWPAVPRPDEFIVKPRDLERSRLYWRVVQHDMPPLGGLLTHVAAADLLREWILGLQGPPALASVQIRWTQTTGKRFRVQLVHQDPAAAVRYTTDCTLPGPDSPRYLGSFQVGQSTMVRAAAFREGFVPSRISSHLIDASER